MNTPTKSITAILLGVLFLAVVGIFVALPPSPQRITSFT